MKSNFGTVVVHVMVLPSLEIWGSQTSPERMSDSVVPSEMTNGVPAATSTETAILMS